MPKPRASPTQSEVGHSKGPEGNVTSGGRPPEKKNLELLAAVCRESTCKPSAMFTDPSEDRRDAMNLCFLLMPGQD